MAGITFPRTPPDDIQPSFMGSAKGKTLAEAFRFWQAVLVVRRTPVPCKSPGRTGS